MCIKFSWSLRELLWALSYFQLTFWILTLLYVDAVINLLDDCDAAIGLWYIDLLKYTYFSGAKNV